MFNRRTNLDDQQLAAKNRQALMSDALIEDDQKNSDFLLFMVVFVIIAGVTVFVAQQVTREIGPMVIVISMVTGLAGAGAFAARMGKKRMLRDKALRQEREAQADAERAVQLAALKKARFDAGL